MCRVKRRLLYLVLVALLLAPWPLAAQTAVTLMWNQASPSNVTGYRVSVDGAWRDYGSTLVGAGGTCICSVGLSLSVGSHTLIVAAYNSRGETVSAPLVHTVPPITPHTLPPRFAGLAEPGDGGDRRSADDQTHVECAWRDYL